MNMVVASQCEKIATLEVVIDTNIYIKTMPNTHVGRHNHDTHICSFKYIYIYTT